MRLDPDAAARVASFGEMPPMRVRGLAAVREAIEAAPHPDHMPSMAHIEDCAIPGPASEIPIRIYRPSSASGQPVLVYSPRRRNGDGLQPFVRAAGENACRRVERDRGVRRLPARSESPPPAQFDDAYTATAWVADNADRLGVDPSRGWRSSATAPAARWPPPSRWPPAITTDRPSAARCCSTPASIATWPHRRSPRWPTRRCSPSTTSSTCTTSPTAVRAHHTTITACRPTRRTCRGLPPAIVVTARMRSDSRLGRALRRAPARRTGADDRHPLPRHVPRLPDALRRHRAGQAGNRRDRRALAGEIRQPAAVLNVPITGQTRPTASVTNSKIDSTGNEP